MCHRCEKKRQENYKNIRELLNEEGELWDDICSRSESLYEAIKDDSRFNNKMNSLESVKESLRAEMIAVKLAEICALANNGPYTGDRPYIILGEWGLHMLEFEEEMKSYNRKISRLGIGEN